MTVSRIFVNPETTGLLSVKRSPARERRIHDEIIVDASGPEEQAMGWYYYLESTIRFPFPCGGRRRVGSVLRERSVGRLGAFSVAHTSRPSVHWPYE